MNSDHAGDGSDTYVHRPSGADADSDARADADSDARADDGVDVRGWVLLAVVVLSFLVIPGVIYLRPATPAESGLPFLAAMLVLPMVPAVILGLTAVWSMKKGT